MAKNELFDVKNKTALITGGSSGIGAFFAKVLSQAGARVYLVGWRASLLRKVLGDKNGRVFPIASL